MSDLIDRQEAVKALGDAHFQNYGNAIMVIQDLPSAEHVKQMQNDPLDWEQLKQMEGKPVWIEAKSLSIGVNPYWKDWYIIKSFSDDEFMRCNDGYEWAKETQGRMWQAYRKERE